jgi:hypothetical protein
VGVPSLVGTKTRLLDFEVLGGVFFVRHVAFEELQR